MKNSRIEWTHHTFNPWRGCTKVSPGCANCYAETLSGRNPKTLGIWGPSGTRVVASEAMWREPLKWNREAKAAMEQYERLVSDPNYTKTEAYANGFRWTKPERPRVFCASLADVFEDWKGRMIESNEHDMFDCCQCHHWWSADMTDYDPTKRDSRPICQRCKSPGPNQMTMADVRRRLFSLIPATPNLDWLLLTKRPENLRAMLPAAWISGAMPPNVWLGTSVENQQAADERIPHLLSVPAAVRFLSCEPLLGPVDISRWLVDDHTDMARAGWPFGLSWVIVGGESGRGARPMNLSWARGLVSQCKAAGVPVFVKQLGACPVTTHWSDSKPSTPHDVPWTHRDKSADRCTGRQKPLVLAGFADKKGGDWNEWPSDLRVREFPKGGASS